MRVTVLDVLMSDEIAVRMNLLSCSEHRELWVYYRRENFVVDDDGRKCTPTSFGVICGDHGNRLTHVTNKFRCKNWLVCRDQTVRCFARNIFRREHR